MSCISTHVCPFLQYKVIWICNLGLGIGYRGGRRGFESCALGAICRTACFSFRHSFRRLVRSSDI
ncbi:hypothetical protein M407DRAFT_126287 [Tulasnella calospora MUT 4182]|uniref:Uncharacterized protein n=1 Tax=Tulasnella calospora MUT 4182 TaxID=1051891 RepID=A0A0C3LJ23_9AGAM|nr:hypothetical protein M407DRAFT_126287 [Tulasnella calospora MUT 4182]